MNAHIYNLKQHSLMKTLKHFSLVFALLCCSYFTNAQGVCGTASFQQYVSGTSIHAYSNSTLTDTTSHYTWHVTNANGLLVQTQTGATNYIVTQNLPAGVYSVCLLLYHGTAFCDSTCHADTVGCTSISGDFTFTTGAGGLVSFSSLLTSSTLSFSPFVIAGK